MPSPENRTGNRHRDLRPATPAVPDGTVPADSPPSNWLREDGPGCDTVMSHKGRGGRGWNLDITKQVLNAEGPSFPIQGPVVCSHGDSNDPRTKGWSA